MEQGGQQRPALHGSDALYQGVPAFHRTNTFHRAKSAFYGPDALHPGVAAFYRADTFDA
jgi:hypothetical protein